MHRSHYLRFPLYFTVAIACMLPLAGQVSGHVILLDPDGGEVLDVGSGITIRWTVAIQHNMEDWDLWYSNTGEGGPWIEIATDLPAGDPTAGSIHTYEWTVPNNQSNQIRVRVRQDNV